MNLCIDIGNTSTKAAIFEDGRLTERFEAIDWFAAADRFPRADRTIVVSTSGKYPSIEGALRLDYTTPVPLKNRYSTSATLGMDRLAAAVGAHNLYPRANVLIVDLGTAITFDLVSSEGEFLGGNISPGAAMRFRALSEFTEKLPLLDLQGATETKFPADNTHDAIENGVVEGILAEIDHYWAMAEQRLGGVNVLFTGGDANYFAERTKNAIFVVSDLVFYGLNAILEQNN